MTRGLFLADPRVEPADLVYGFAFFKLTAAGRKALIVVPAPRGPDPRIGSAGPKMVPGTKLAASWTKASLVPGRYSDRLLS